MKKRGVLLGASFFILFFLTQKKRGGLAPCVDVQSCLHMYTYKGFAFLSRKMALQMTRRIGVCLLWDFLSSYVYICRFLFSLTPSIFFYLYLFLGFFFFLPLKKGLAPAKRKTHILICPFLHTLPTPAYIAHTMSTYVYMYKFFFSLGVGVLGVIYSWVFFS